MLKILFFPIILMLHPVHVTLTTITQEPGADSMKVFFRMYYDDFLRDYKLYDPKCEIGKYSASQSFPGELLNRYFNEKVRIAVNNRKLTGKYTAIAIRDNEILMNLVFLSEKDPHKIKVINNVLTGLYSDQANMIYITVNRNERAMRLTPDHDRETCPL